MSGSGRSAIKNREYAGILSLPVEWEAKAAKLRCNQTPGRLSTHHTQKGNTLMPNDTFTYCLYGVADRDPEELVCMFTETIEQANEFRLDLPGKYRILLLDGVDYNTLVPWMPDAENGYWYRFDDDGNEEIRSLEGKLRQTGDEEDAEPDGDEYRHEPEEEPQITHRGPGHWKSPNRFSEWEPVEPDVEPQEGPDDDYAWIEDSPDNPNVPRR